MPQNLAAAREESAYVLDLIGKKSLTEAERRRVIEESVRYWTDHVNEGFLQYRKSVSTDYTAVEWDDAAEVTAGRVVEELELLVLFVFLWWGLGTLKKWHKTNVYLIASRKSMKTG